MKRLPQGLWQHTEMALILRPLYYDSRSKMYRCQVIYGGYRLWMPVEDFGESIVSMGALGFLLQQKLGLATAAGVSTEHVRSRRYL